MKLPSRPLLAVGFMALPLIARIIVRQRYPHLLVPDNLLEALDAASFSYGRYIIFIIGIVEGSILINTYFPGATLIFTSAALAGAGQLSLPLSDIILFGSAGITLGYALSYSFGRLGLYNMLASFKVDRQLEAMRTSMENNRHLAFFLASLHPNPASIMAVAAGVLKIDFISFILLFAVYQLLWSTIWGVLFYVFGTVVFEYILQLAVLFTVIYLVFLASHRRFSNQAN